MKQNVSKILQRQLLLMGYKSNYTLSENLEQIKNKPFIVEQGAADRYTDYINSEQGLKQHDIDQANKIAKTYPNYCPFKEYTVLPGETEIKGKKGTSEVEGVDVIPKGVSGETYCAYRGAKNTLLFLPTFIEDATFVKGTPDEYTRMLRYAEESDYFLEVGKTTNKTVNKNPDPITKELKKAYLNYVMETFPPGTVFNFSINGDKFSPLRQRVNPTEGIQKGASKKISLGSFQGMGVGDGGSDFGGIMNPEVYFKFLGYYSWDSKKYYEPPKLEERREDWQIFVDDWGTLIAIGASVAAAIIGSFFGATEAVILEILIEGIIGGVMAYRDFQKGNNIGVAFNIFFALCPWLKLSKYFRGISDEVFKSLAKKLGESGLSSSSSLDEYVRWYESADLTEQERKLFTMFMEYDDITKQKMVKELAEGLKNKGADEIIAFMEAEGIIQGGFKGMVEAHPELLSDVKFLQKLWAKELTLQLGVGVGIGFMVNLCCSDMFNDNDKAKLSELETVIPDSLKEMIAINLAMNAEKSPEITNALYDGLQSNVIPEAVNNTKEYWLSTAKDSVLNAGGTPVIIDSTSMYEGGSWVIDSKIKRMNDRQLQKLKDDGWVTFSEYKKKYSDVESKEPTKRIENNGVIHDWIKVK